MTDEKNLKRPIARLGGKIELIYYRATTTEKFDEQSERKKAKLKNSKDEAIGDGRGNHLPNHIVIPDSSWNGGIDVELTDSICYTQHMN